MKRKSSIQRRTNETAIEITLMLDGQGQSDVDTGVGFLNHILTAFALHSLIDLRVHAQGDLHIDSHHTIEDVAIVLGQALDQALGDRRGIERMGSAHVPMDDALAFVALDFSGRPYTVLDAKWCTALIGAFPTDLVRHFLETLAVHGRLTLHARVSGRNDHHQAEAIFKALGRAIKQAVAIDPRRQGIASTKGILV